MCRTHNVRRVQRGMAAFGSPDSPTGNSFLLRSRALSRLGAGMVASLVRFGVLVVVIIAIVWHASGTTRGAGALAVGRCGAYGHAFDYATPAAALQAAK